MLRRLTDTSDSQVIEALQNKSFSCFWWKWRKMEFYGRSPQTWRWDVWPSANPVGFSESFVALSRASSAGCVFFSACLCLLVVLRPSLLHFVSSLCSCQSVHTLKASGSPNLDLSFVLCFWHPNPSLSPSSPFELNYKPEDRKWVTACVWQLDSETRGAL